MSRLTVVMYHYVRHIQQSRYPDIKGLELDQFIEQLQYLCLNYTVVSMEQVLAATEGLEPLPDKAVLLTFDDGYAEHFSHVYPILKSMNMQGSFFVPAKTVLEHKVLDVNKVHFTLASCHDIQELLDSLRRKMEHYQDEFQLRSYDEYYAEYAIANRFDSCEIIFIKRMLQHALPEALRFIIADHLFSQYVEIEDETFCRELYMDCYQLEQMIRDGMHVGCHGYDHYWWGELNNDDLQQELVKSKSFLSSIGCDMSRWTACYPYGSFNDHVIAALRQQGCKLALTTQPGVTDLSNSCNYRISRLDTNDFPPRSNNYTQY